MVHLSSGDNEQFMYNVNPKNTLLSVLTVVTLSAILTACTSGRYQQQYDSIPDRLPNKAELRDAIPRPEAKSRGVIKTTKCLANLIKYYILLKISNK